MVSDMEDNSQKHINFQQLSKKEKARLKNRITGSVYSYLKRRSVLKYGAGITAAAIIIILSIDGFNSSKMRSLSIDAFVNTTRDLEPSAKVQLVLSEEHNIEISEDNSSISYSSTGQHVQIGKDHSVSQKTLHKEKPVFNTLIVPFGKRAEIMLSDGSKVWLNSGSKLVFPAQFGESKREVYLEGEAVFEVSYRQKQAFIVKSEQQVIEVLGTVFNLSNYKDDPAIYTTLKSGSIQIHRAEGKFFNSETPIKITPGSMASFDKKQKTISVKPVLTEPYFSWRDGIFIFKNDSLKAIMKKISRYYNVEIVINDQNLANETFSGHLDVKESIEHVMQTIKATQSSEFDYHITHNNQLIIN